MRRNKITEKQIKEILNGIINNGEKWEYRWCTADGWSNWKEYKLGCEIYDGYEYRKVETWCVFKGKDNIYLRGKKENDRIELVFEGTKEECEKWIEEHTKKSWFEDYLKLFPKSGQKETCRIVCKEVTKKILEEVDNRFNHSTSVYSILEDIIKDLGIEL